MCKTTLINYTINIKTKLKLYGIASAILTLVVPYILLLRDQDNHLESAQSLCPFKMLTGFPCPGCGITKSLVYLYEGNLLKSVQYHVLGPFVIVFCLIIIMILTLELYTKKEFLNGVFFNLKLAYVVAVFLGIYHFIRLCFFIKNNTINEILKQSLWQ